MKILIFGSEGMLGREILYQLVLLNKIKKNLKISATCRGNKYTDLVSTDDFNAITNFDASSSDNIINILNQESPNVVINCIGIVKQYGSTIPDHEYFFLNSSLPRIINFWCVSKNSKLIHFSTDCVFSGNKGDYTLTDLPDAVDVYGLSKRLGEIINGNTLTIRTSIIGFEKSTRRGLLSWFFGIAPNTEINGYTKVMYSGLTTTYLANLVIKYYLNSKQLGLIQLGGEKISKYDLLKLANNIFNKQIIINKYDKIINDKSFESLSAYKDIGINQPTWEDMLKDLNKNSINNNK